ncbi:unnamed protein product [Adineta ricciae]|uniref:Uncharacterized protein n=1 Tax=Adineta ricciae TaxID=249248 RepID=A0A814JZJ0_ADIRI|nr:unnamed protein product [Adineta ricciae]
MLRALLLHVSLAFFYQSTYALEHLPIQYTFSNISIALMECRNQSSLFPTSNACNILLTNSFYQGLGSCVALCLNQRDIPDNAMQFDFILRLFNETFSFYSRSCFTCTSNSSGNSPFVTDWIHWQLFAINETIRVNGRSNGRMLLHSKDYQIYGSSYNNTTQLCTNNFDGNITSSMASADSYVSETTSCSQFDHRYTNATDKISLLMKQLIDFYEPNQYSTNTQDDTTQTTVFTMKSQHKSSGPKLLKIVGIVMSAILSIILFLLLIVCLVHRNNYRQGYQSAETSATL